ncbi:hypothetical protein ASG29_10535 [Sphingomonas sp. Leaf412]|uniref:anti-sigma factor n=1 Tax=Sphingomonas sp. Leaf412 TaxID=1736370 RepID=UPI0006F79A3B|nr:anti-sigma factor [Sphingomonas sp. Leaf412]KQT32248.1 hypothetical protein ASG29_10535 [Sphingomonas sp. Leaf412]
MTPDTPDPAGEEPDVMAAELALGVLDGEERAVALRRLLAEPAFARDAERWRTYFAALFAQWPEAEPGEDAERRIMALAEAPRRQSRFWTWATGLSTLAAAGLLAALIDRPVRLIPVPAPAPRAAPAAIPLVAVLAPEDAKPFGAIYDPATREVRLAGGIVVPTQRDAELWAIGADGVPKALGLLARDGAGRIRITPRQAIGAGVTLAISIEPLGGSPKDTPTGPVVATGTLTLI